MSEATETTQQLGSLNRESFPASQGELNMLARAVVEMAALIDECLARLGAPRVEHGRAVHYARTRIRKLDAGRWGEDGIEAFKEELTHRPVVDPALDADALLRAEYMKQAQALGGRIAVGSGGATVQWPPEPGDRYGRKRHQLAKERALGVLATQNGGQS